MATAVILIITAVILINSQREPAIKTSSDTISKSDRIAVTPATKKQPPAPVKSQAQSVKPKVRKNINVALPAASASVNFSVLPWGEVFVDGKSFGASPPLKVIKIAPGPHIIEIKNGMLSPYRETVNLESGVNMKIKHKFY
jgi:serine/threonine-protein kinase